VVLAFLFVWAIGVLAELQRSESLTLDKFLHLPVSLSGVFMLNYLSSLLSLNLVFFVPTMVGLSLGLACARGPVMLLLLPAVTAFVLMVTALTYQFQGWLASLMVNKQRRKTILVMVTLVFVLISQLPMMINLFHPWEESKEELARREKEHADRKSALDKGEIEPAEYGRREGERVHKANADAKERTETLLHQFESIAWIANLAVPIGWLPFGSMELVEGNVWPALAGTLGMAILGTASLWRAYRTTVRLYTGQFTAGQNRPDSVAAPAPAPVTAGRPLGNFLERNLPWLSEPAAVIALGGFRSLTRAPEAKMLFLTPIILLMVIVGLSLREPINMPELLRPLAAFGPMSLLLITTAQFLGNQFGFDRGGFRVFVLSPVPRRDILLGKNLAVAPIALVLCSFIAVLIEVLYPMRIDHLLALAPHWISMYLLFCMLMNLMSILAPMRVAHGSLKPATTKLIPALLQMMFVFLLPITMLPTLVPLGIEAGLELLGVVEGLPIYLVLSVVECVGIAFVYRVVLSWEGDLLQMREQAILDIVTKKSE
jgi:ABC-2 type transport system permease protein